MIIEVLEAAGECLRLRHVPHDVIRDPLGLFVSYRWVQVETEEFRHAAVDEAHPQVSPRDEEDTTIDRFEQGDELGGALFRRTALPIPLLGKLRILDIRSEQPAKEGEQIGLMRCKGARRGIERTERAVECAIAKHNRYAEIRADIEHGL